MSAATAQRVLITGISGQDGSYLAELLCAEGREVHGTVRRAADRDAANLEAVRDSVTLHQGDLLEPGTLRAVIDATKPDEIYHLAAPAFVPDSWRLAAETMQAIATLTGELIDAVRDHVPRARVVVATSREIFGSAAPSPQREDTPCVPSSPYGVAKLAAHQLVGLLRAHDGLHLCSAILFNHESPRRDPQFLSRKVTRAAAAISLGRQDELTLGDTERGARLVGRRRRRARAAPDGRRAGTRRLRIGQRRRVARYASSSTWPSRASASRSSATCASILRWSGRARTRTRSATRPARASGWGGGPRRASSS